MKQQQPDAMQLLRLVPTKWALAILAVVLLYAIVQPTLNRRLGWNLPSLASRQGESPADRQAPPGPDNTRTPANSTTESASNATLEERGDEPEGDGSTSPLPAPPVEPPPKDSSPETGRSSRPELLHGLLREISSRRYESPAGLIYGPGSEHGHRLKHIEHHMQDNVGRDIHGVFDGDMASVLRWIDDAYQRGMRGAKGTTKRKEDGRDIIEATFNTPIGFVGGKSGRRKGNPATKRLRLVVQERSVITAFPF